jgi:NO-binding membrane sensor protein with MHYT domain
MVTELEPILSIDYNTLVLISMSAAVLGISLLAIALWLENKTPSARSRPLIAVKGFAIITLIVAAVGVWFASTTQARIGPPMNGARIDPLQLMTTPKDMPTDHFVDYSLVYE